jgi:hypothetical protein
MTSLCLYANVESDKHPLIGPLRKFTEQFSNVSIFVMNTGRKQPPGD